MSYSTEIINPAQLNPAQREALTTELYASHCRIFEGVGEDEFARYVIDSPADRTRILIIRDEDNVIRGYTAFHVFLMEMNGKRLGIIRMEAGVERELRKTSMSGPFIIAEFLRTNLLYPRHQMLFMACFVHPSAYVALHRHAPQVWPSPNAEVPGEMHVTMAALAQRFHLSPASQPGTYKVGWVTLDACEPRKISPMAEYYLSRNPNYTQGEGLLTVIPISIRRLIQGSMSYLSFRLQRLRRPSLQPQNSTASPIIESNR